MGLLVCICVSSKTKPAKPGQAQGADGGHRPTENGGGHSPGQAVISCTQYHDDSPVGATETTSTSAVTPPLLPSPKIEAAFIDKMEAVLTIIRSLTLDLESYRFSAVTLEDAMDVICELDEEGHWLDERLDEMEKLIYDQREALGE